MKTKLFLLLAIFCNIICAQEKDFGYKVIDTIHFKELKAYHITFEKCPGIMSGIPCTRYLNYLAKQEPTKCKIKNYKHLSYEFEQDNILIFDIQDADNNIFNKLNIDIYDKSNFTIKKLKKKGKFYVNEILYSNLKVYKILMKKDLINELLFKNIMVNSNEDYISVYLIYN